MSLGLLASIFTAAVSKDHFDTHFWFLADTVSILIGLVNYMFIIIVANQMYSYHDFKVNSVKRAADALASNFKAIIEEWIEELETEETSKSGFRMSLGNIRERRSTINEHDDESGNY